MRMAMKYSADELGATSKQEVLGRVKSDITHGHENLYERSYY